MVGTALLWVEMQAHKAQHPSFTRNSVCSSCRHLVAILKEDKETFGFEIQVRLK